MAQSSKIEVIQGDITKMTVDAIVNAANASLMGGGGVDGAIHRAGGPVIQEECRVIVEKLGRCETGNAVLTTAGNMPAKFIIHTVGPVWYGGHQNETSLLENAYANSLKVAAERGIETIAFPNISTGIYGFPKDKAAAIAIRTVTGFMSDHPQIKQVYFVCFDQDSYAIYERLLSSD